MRVKQVNYTEDEDIKDVTVVMSKAEAVAIVNIAGKLNGLAHEKLQLKDGDSLYDALTDLFNRHYEDGAPDLHVQLEHLNSTL